MNSSERVGAMHHNDADGAVRCGRVGDAEDRRKRTIAVVAVARWRRAAAVTGAVVVGG